MIINKNLHIINYTHSHRVNEYNLTHRSFNWENFRPICKENMQLDPIHFFHCCTWLKAFAAIWKNKEAVHVYSRKSLYLEFWA